MYNYTEHEQFLLEKGRGRCMMVSTDMANAILTINHLARGSDMFRIVICDDDSLLLRKIEDEVKNFFEYKEIKVKIHTFTGAKQVSDQLLSSCDIALLDVDFPQEDFNGMDIARRIRGLRQDTIIIFITNFIEYAPAGYEVQAFRYILKRELQSELKPYLQQATEQLQSAREQIKIQVNGEIIDLIVDDIMFFEVQQHNVTVHVRKDALGKQIKVYNIYGSLTNLEQQLESQGFLRIHKSYMVNMRHLSKFQCREAILDNGMRLRVGEKSYAEKKKKYLLWKGWH